MFLKGGVFYKGKYDITEEKIDRAIARLKQKKKAVKKDDIKNEAWLHANKETKGKLREITLVNTKNNFNFFLL